MKLRCALLVVLGLLGCISATEAAMPNVLFVMADDLGYGDPQCNNPQSKIATPNIDRLASQGLRFTDAHAPAAVCVPTRYGLMTGRYPFRMQRKPIKVAAERTTIASLLKSKGYATGMVGKWHLGVEHEKDPSPDVTLGGGPFDRGFASYYGIPASLDIPPYYWIANNRCVAPPSEKIEGHNTPGWSNIQGAFWRGGGIAPGFEMDAVLPTVTGKAIDFIKQHHEQAASQPFFLYVAFTGPHTPWLPTEDFAGKSKVPLYGDFVQQVDNSLGRILAVLDKLKLADNTLVFFTSDNGPVWYPENTKKYGHSATATLRGMKGDAWEAGHRMPFMARWPGHVPAGQTSDEVICFTDMLATFAALTEAKLPAGEGADSVNILPVLLGEKYPSPIREATIHQSSHGVLALRQGRWKLIPALGSGGFTKPSTAKPQPGEPAGQLYDLSQDLGEQQNVYAQHPDVVKRMTELLDKYRHSQQTVAR